MIIVLRPIGRGNWQPLELEVRRGQEMLFPALRDGEVKPEQRWIIFGREYRVVEIRR